MQQNANLPEAQLSPAASGLPDNRPKSCNIFKHIYKKRQERNGLEGKERQIQHL